MNPLTLTLTLLALTIPVPLAAQARARDLGIPLEGRAGRYDAITDVPGVEVGATTLIRGSGRLVVGRGPVRTGVTAIFPRGRSGSDSVFAGWFTLNGNGEMTGTTWVAESGRLDTPILITNTHSVGVVRDAVIGWMTRNRPGFLWALPVVAETYDGVLNDAEGFHVKAEHVRAALDGARGGTVAEGNTGGGTGMNCHGFKGGTGTASRILDPAAGGYTVGVLVQCNYGQRRRLSIAGVPVGQEIRDLVRCYAGRLPPSRPWLSELPPCAASARRRLGADPPSPRDEGAGSIIIVVATDAPLLPHQLERIAQARRAGRGTGGRSGGERLRRHLSRLLHGQPGGRRRHRPCRAHHAAQRPDQRPLRGHGAGHGRGDHQRDAGGGDHDGGGQRAVVRASARPAAGSPAEVQPAGALIPGLRTRGRILRGGLGFRQRGFRRP